LRLHGKKDSYNPNSILKLVELVQILIRAIGFLFLTANKIRFYFMNNGAAYKQKARIDSDNRYRGPEYPVVLILFGKASVNNGGNTSRCEYKADKHIYDKLLLVFITHKMLLVVGCKSG
jgi:hypothetical protein